MLAIALTLAAPRFGIAAGDSGDAPDLVQFRQEIDSLKGSEAAERRRRASGPGRLAVCFQWREHPRVSATGATAKDKALLTQLSIGF